MGLIAIVVLAASAAAPGVGAADAPFPNSRFCGAPSMPSETRNGQTVIRHSDAAGDGATVIRRGPEGEIVLEQHGPCNAAAVTQQGADNRAVVRQHGGGNRVVINQGGSGERSQ